MQRIRPILGLIAGALMIVSSFAHSVLGWKALSEQLRVSQAPADLVQALGLGWTFGGVAMLAFGLIVVASFRRQLRQDPVSTTPAHVIGAAYVAFGAGALWVTAFDPFFLIFLVPGLLVLVASLPRRAV